MRRLKLLAAVGLATLGMGVGAASAQALTRDQAAWQDITNRCRYYQGCGYITLIQKWNTNGSCRQYQFKFHTRYNGWKYYTTGIYCTPPYSP